MREYVGIDRMGVGRLSIERQQGVRERERERVRYGWVGGWMDGWMDR